MGLGRHGGGVATARWLVEQGASVTVTDTATAESLQATLAQLADLPGITFRLGTAHDAADFTQSQMIVVNPAVKIGHPLVELARRHGECITSEADLFLRHNPGRLVAITGTTGKTTTASMLAAMCRAAGLRTWLGGNIGRSLLADLPHILPGDIVIMELSSFQLAWLGDDVPRPQIGIVTNCSPHHLDWHGSWAAYRQAKQRLITGPIAAQRIILPSNCAEVAQWAELAENVVAPHNLPPQCQLELAGVHQRGNAELAYTAARCLGVADDVALETLTNFSGLPHRLESIGHVAGRRFVNDSKATSAAATIAALQTCPKPIWLLAGGVYGGSHFDELAAAISQHAAGAVFFGRCRNEFATAVRAVDPQLKQQVADTLAAAVQTAWQWSSPGDTMLLSPACASHDQFADYAARGDAFRQIAQQLAKIHGGEILDTGSLQYL
jgi:UDP-N-acetylmuramoylalanine--D-glutamate ligase